MTARGLADTVRVGPVVPKGLLTMTFSSFQQLIQSKWPDMNWIFSERYPLFEPGKQLLEATSSILSIRYVNSDPHWVIQTPGVGSELIISRGDSLVDAVSLAKSQLKEKISSLPISVALKAVDW